jgi:hypothetical protein
MCGGGVAQAQEHGGGQQHGPLGGRGCAGAICAVSPATNAAHSVKRQRIMESPFLDISHCRIGNDSNQKSN